VVPFQTHVWYPQSFNPTTGLMYVGVRYATYGMVSEAGAKMGNQLLSINVAKRPEAAAPKLEGTGGWLTAWDPVKQKEAWRSREGNAGSGTMTTAGNLVFQGTAPRNLTAFRADTGEKLWSADAGVNISAGSISYEIGGTQYVAAVGAGAGANPSRLVVYRLGGTAQMPPPAPPAAPQAFNPPANFGDAALLAKGQQLYQQNCTICHEGGRGIGGIPDLRTTPMMQNTALFKAVVIDGALTDNGMLPFNKVMTADDAEAIRAHVVALANDLKANPQRGFGGFGPPGGAAPRAPGTAAAAPAAEQPAAGLHQ
jgi:mono/diheme cytochrome c family protein